MFRINLQPARPAWHAPAAVACFVLAAMSAASLLRRNLLIYGLGGIIVPFVGIKIIDVIIHSIGLA